MSLELVPKKAPRASLPALISGAGKRAAWRFVEFFTVNIRNPNTRAAYGLAAGAFVRRQLFLLLDDNYFSLSTTITS
jgi:hypothetical protein